MLRRFTRFFSVDFGSFKKCELYKYGEGGQVKSNSVPGRLVPPPGSEGIKFPAKKFD